MIQRKRVKKVCRNKLFLTLPSVFNCYLKKHNTKPPTPQQTNKIQNNSCCTFYSIAGIFFLKEPTYFRESKNKKGVRDKRDRIITVPRFEKKSPFFTVVTRGICARLALFEIFISDPQRGTSSEVTKFADDRE